MCTQDSIIEAAILTSKEPLSEKKMCSLFSPALSMDKLIDVLDKLQQRWENRGLTLIKTPQGWQFKLVECVLNRLENLHELRTPKYSRAVMETLAIIAYKQPVTRGDIEMIRGVSVSTSIIQTLQERQWITENGFRETIGKPTLWVTTDKFLSDFQISDIVNLPNLKDFDELIIKERL